MLQSVSDQQVHISAGGVVRHQSATLCVVLFLGFACSTPALAADASFLSATNADRAAIAVAPLSYSAQLNAAAESKLADMFANNYWAHVSPQGHDASYFIDATGYSWVAWAENLAKDYATPAAVVAAWMNSSYHKTNMLNASYREVGFAIGSGTIDGKQTTLSVAMYGSTIQGKTVPITRPQATPTPSTLTAKPAPPKTPVATTPSPTPTPTPQPSPSASPGASPSASPANSLLQPPRQLPAISVSPKNTLQKFFELIGRAFAQLGLFFARLLQLKK